MKAKRTWDCVKKNPLKDSAPNDNFLIGFGFVATHVVQNSTLFGVGGEVSLVILISLERS